MDFEYIIAILTIVGIDIVLGGDNAIVIALASRNLPEKKRNLAILLGTGLAIVVRILLTVLAVFLLKIPYLQVAGGLLLIWIAYKLLADNNDDTSNIKAGNSLFAAVRTIVIADVVMGLDNVLAIAGAAHGDLRLVVFGLLVSVPIIVWGSRIILMLMERFSLLIYIGAGILAYTAGKMIVHEERLAPFFTNNPALSIFVPIVVIIAVIMAGYLSNRRGTSESIR